ncbi:MAG: ATP-binding protein [Bacteroidetes bacterium]|nr:ATP-binding protein [Bacteroidota bacterium]
MKIAIASGKGGTGKTLVATNLFQLFLDENIDATLIDCDTEVPNSSLFFKTKEKERWGVEEIRPVINEDKCIYCGKCADNCTFNAILCIAPQKRITLLKDLCHGCGACLIDCEYDAIKSSKVITGETSRCEYMDKSNIFEGRMYVKNNSSVPTIKNTIKHATEYPSRFYLLDSPPGTSCPFIHTAIRSDFVIIVTEPTPFGLSDLNQTMSTLKRLEIPFGVIINRSDLGDKYLAQDLKDNGVNVICSIPFSKDIAKSYAQGHLVFNLSEEIKSYFTQIKNFILDYENSNR